MFGLIFVNFGPLKNLPKIYPPKSVRIEISKINQTFFKNRNQLKQIFLLIDIRHKLQIIDLEFMSFLKSIDRDFTIIFTKKDKIKYTVVANYCKYFLKSIENIYEKEEYFVSSSKTKLLHHFTII